MEKEKHLIEMKGERLKKFREAKKHFGYRASTKFIDALVNQTSLIMNYFKWFMIEKSKVGNNINQIAKHLNSGEILDDRVAKQLEEILKKEDEMLEILKKHASK